MCIFPKPVVISPPAADIPPTPVAPPPPAPPAPAPVMGTSSAASPNAVMQNIYDPSNPESGINAEKGATMKKAQGTSQLRVDLDPVIANMAKQTGLQINK
jgi:hypothetical protein